MSKFTYVVLNGGTKIAGPLPWGNGAGVTATGVANVVQMLTAAGCGAHLKIKQVESSEDPTDIGKVWPNPKSRNPEAQRAAGIALAAKLGLVPSAAQIEVHREPLSARQAEHDTRSHSQGGRDRMMYSDQDTNRLIDALKQAFPKEPKRTFESWDSPAMNVLDCVLSLNRHYERICAPRLTRFNAAHADVETLAQLTQLIGKYPSPLQFSIAELDYRDERRAATLVGVLAYLDRAKNAFQGESEASRLRRWAESVTPEDYQAPGVRGFGLAGFQYLRMLFGAQTAKPDVHICRFISEAIGRKVPAERALALLEIAAKRLGWPLLELDNEIWEFRAKSGKLK